MVGLDQFLQMFGNITVSKIIGFGLTLLFCWKIYQQIKKFLEHKKELLIKKHEVEKEKHEKLNLALEEVAKYPQYREQSRKIQQEFRSEIDELKESQKILADTQQSIQAILKEMQEKNDKRERSKIKDRLLQSYRYYTSIEHNPGQSWTKMEAEAFWELFGEYESAGGNGFMHTVVQPAMNSLKIIDN